MAYYTYKQVRDVMPSYVMTTEYMVKICCSGGVCLNTKNLCVYDGDAGYDGDMWVVTATYINELQTKLKEVKNEFNIPDSIISETLIHA
jgi:hypothetical protein